jgi:hypothetical protein
MRVPSFLHGRFAEVSRSAKRVARELQRGAHLQDVVDSWVDLRDLPGLIVLDGPSKLLGGSPHFHAFALTRAVADSLLPLTEAKCHGWVDESLREAWSFLGLLGQHGSRFARTARDLDLLDAAVAHWSSMTSLGARYSAGLDRGSHAWDAQVAVRGALAGQGVATTHLSPPETGEELAQLVSASPGRTIQRLLEADKQDEAATILAQTSFDDFVLCSLAEHFARAGETATAVAVLRRHAERADPHGLLSTWIAEHGESHGPVAVSDVREAFLRRPDLAAWTRLKQVGIAADAEEALEELGRRGKPEIVMWVRVWDGDGERALAAWEAMWSGRAADRVSLGFAARSVAQLLASSRPARAAELHVLVANTILRLKKPSAYREAAGHLRSACDAYRAAGAPERAQTTIAEFRSEHRRLTRLMTILDEVGLK